MYDPKTIRRRRAVLALLVVSSVVLLTASFGGSGGVGSVQRGVFQIVSPIQDGASRSLKPVRDLFGWFGDTWRAKGQSAGLKKERDRYREENVVLQGNLRKLATAAGIGKVDRTASLDQLHPVDARVYGVSPTLLFQSFYITKGSGDGVRVGQAVVSDGGLVGKVADVTGGYSKVTLITDVDFGAQAMVARTGTPGTVVAFGGSPEDLAMTTTVPRAPVPLGATIVTRGTDVSSRRLPSLFPPDIAIGKVFRVDDAGTDTQVVHLRPLVDVRSIEHVQVLTGDPLRIP